KLLFVNGQTSLSLCLLLQAKSYILGIGGDEPGKRYLEGVRLCVKLSLQDFQQQRAFLDQLYNSLLVSRDLLQSSSKFS
ncbi:MAG: hypothetical protein NZL98_11210, partial [Anaerolineales bacterium]|nr:hypothetical protein [Anaerolineales bacterium]